MTEPKIDEDTRHRLESELRSGRNPNLHEFVPQPDSTVYLSTLEEFVMIELEHRWNEPGNSSRLGDYLSRNPVLRTKDIIQRLVDEEMLIRTDRGHEVTLDEYRRWLPESMDHDRTLHQNYDGKSLRNVEQTGSRLECAIVPDRICRVRLSSDRAI